MKIEPESLCSMKHQALMSKLPIQNQIVVVQLTVVQSDSVTPWVVACQASLSMGFSRQEYCSGLLSPPLGSLPNSGIEPLSSALVDGFFTAEPPGNQLHTVSKWRQKLCLWSLHSLPQYFIGSQFSSVQSLSHVRLFATP